MHLVVQGRIFVARHRWIYWLTIGVVAVGVGLLVKERLDALDAQRSSWGDTRSVLVADGDLRPDGPIEVNSISLPVAAVPPSAVSELPRGARLHQRVASGEVIVAADLVGGNGPARHADPGTVVVGIVDTPGASLSIGLRVQVSSEGVVLADDGTIVGLEGEVIFVAVAERDGPAVASAAHSGLASLLFVP